MDYVYLAKRKKILQNIITEHFDSIGKKPMRYIHNLLISKENSYMYNNRRVQSYKSNTCELFCLFCSFYSCRKASFHYIMSIFSDNLSSNESIAFKCFRDNFKSPIENIDTVKLCTHK